MNRRDFLRHCAAGAVGAAFMVGTAVAESFEGSVVAQLRGQGYREVNVERTMLGRVRIVAAKNGGTREIILNPRTGEILRDVVQAQDGRVEPQISEGDGSDEASSWEDRPEDGDASGNGSSGDASGDDGKEDDGNSGDGEGSDGEGSDGEGGDGKGGDGKDGGGKGED